MHARDNIIITLKINTATCYLGATVTCRINITTSSKPQTIGPGFTESTKKHTTTTAYTAIQTQKGGAHYVAARSLGSLDGGNIIPMPPLFFHMVVSPPLT